MLLSFRPRSYVNQLYYIRKTDLTYRITKIFFFPSLAIITSDKINVVIYTAWLRWQRLIEKVYRKMLGLDVHVMLYGNSWGSSIIIALPLALLFVFLNGATRRKSFRWSDGSTQRLMWSVTFIEVCFFGALKYSPVLFIYKFIQHAYIQQPIYHNSDWKIIKSLVFQWYCSYVYKLFHPSLIIATCDCLNKNILNFSNVQENSWN